MNYIVDRLQERSTWQGIVCVAAAAFGIIEPSYAIECIFTALGGFGGIQALTKG